MKELRCICGKMCQTVVEKYEGKILHDGQLLPFTVEALNFYRCECGCDWFGALTDEQITQETDKVKKMADEILNEEDPYENGYIGSDTIALRKEGNGFVLAKPLCFHAGQ